MRKCKVRRLAAIFCGVVLSGSMLCSCGLLPTEEEFDTAPVIKDYEGNNYNKYTVTRGNMVQKEFISAYYQGTARMEVKGGGIGVQIKRYCVKKGQKVEAGDVLMEDYLPDQEKIIRDSEREMEKMQLQIRQAEEMKKRELQKLKRLKGSKEQEKSISSQYDSQIQNAKSSMALLRLDIKAAKEELAINTVPAEIGGHIVELDRSFEGGFATENDVVMVIEGKKRNRFRAKTEHASYFKNGQEVIISVGGQQYKATAKKTANKKIVYFYPKAELTLKNGVAGSIDLILKEKKDVLYLPAALVYDMGEKKVVYVEGENGVKSIREVKIGERIDNLIEITEGLQENEQVITN